MTDPFAVFGLDRGASLDEVRTARRRLAQEHHPDRGGDVELMQRINAAFDQCVGHVTGRRPLSFEEASAAPAGPGPMATPSPTVLRRRPHGRGWRLEHDAPSFTIDALPAVAFEALLVVATWIGEVVDDDPPYVLECRLDSPLSCWCRLELVPDAGSSTVSLTIGSAQQWDEVSSVSAEQVRDVWVAQLNHLGAPQI